MRYCIVFLGLLLSLTISANDINSYHSIFSNYNYKYELLSNKKILKEVSYKCTVLNAKGKENLLVYIYQNVGDKLESAEISYTRANKVEKTFKLKDLSKVVVDDNLASTSFYSIAGYESSIYPVVIDVKYKISVSNYLNFASIFFISSKDEICKEATVEVLLPKNEDLSYLAKNFTYELNVSELPKHKSYKFTAKDLFLKNYETGQPSELPRLFLNTSEFYFYGKTGSNKSFEHLSSFIWDLWKTEKELPLEHQQYLKDITKDATSDVEKARIVYKYLQDNFRYISIQLGIGGIKTASASSTLRNKYGDCKALTNYMHSALSVLNIESYPVIIYNGVNPPLISSEDFVYNFANHVVLSMPNKGDTIWLECTSKTIEFGYLGYSNENRMAFPLAEKNGKLIPTPVSLPQHSQYFTHTIIDLGNLNTASVQQKMNGSGTMGLVLKSVATSSKTDVTHFLVNYMEWKQPTFFNVNKNDPSQIISFDLSIDNMHTARSGNMYFYPIYPYQIWDVPDLTDSVRKKDLIFYHPFIENDTIIYKIPEGYQLVQTPENITVDNRFFKFSSVRDFLSSTNELKIITSFKTESNIIPPEEYAEFRSKMQQVHNARSARFSIKK